MSSKISSYGQSTVVWTDGSLPKETYEFLDSKSFSIVVKNFLEHLREYESKYLNVFQPGMSLEEQHKQLIDLFKKLYYISKDEILGENQHFNHILSDEYLMHQLIEEFYNFWRRHDRYIICSSNEEIGLDRRPYRTFRDTISHINHLVRKTYRDMCENLTGDSPRVYRQVASGFQVGVIAIKKEFGFLKKYENVGGIPIIRQVLLYPPLILDPPINTRTGQFVKVESNPLEGIDFDSGEWLCYPAKVGDLTIHIYFHNKFISLGCSLSNLFELADNNDLQNKPDAIYAFGVAENSLDRFGASTVFYDDEDNNLLVAAVPRDDCFGYFGYLKKMVLTLHNITMMKRGRLPIHGAMVNITLNSGVSANIVIVGDTGAGKSESLEAFRVLGEKHIRDMTIIFDDMGSLEITEGGEVLAYGSEIGAFVRLDDLQPGFAFGNIDRAIIMSPQKINARAVLPITTLTEVLKGYPVDYFLYANNYEEIDEKHTFLEMFKSPQDAIKVFRDGIVMSKGTTTSTGLVQTYFANIFGPPQYRILHDKIAEKYFDKLFKTGVFVGQLRTRLGISGFESKGPQSAAEALFKAITKRG